MSRRQIMTSSDCDPLKPRRSRTSDGIGGGARLGIPEGGLVEAWMTLEAACAFLELSMPELQELIRTRQLDLGGSTTNPLVLGKSVVTFRRLRERLG
jgi:hypothetical protein